MSLLRATFRSRANYLLALGTEAAAPLLRGLARLASSAPLPPSAWRRGVLLGADHIGDVLYRTASLPLLAEALPDCRWSWFCGPPADAIVEADPLVAGGAVRLPKGVSGTLFRELVGRLREGRYDVALVYDTGSYGRLHLAAALAGIPARIGYVHKGFSGLVTHPIAIRWPQPFAAYFRDLAVQLGASPEGRFGPRLVTTSADETEAARFRAAHGLGTRPVLACACFSRQPVHCQLPFSAYADVARRVRGRTGARLLFLASAGERERLVAALRREGIEDAVLAAGDLGLGAVAALLRGCSALLAADSGLRHVGAAAGIPVVFVRNFGSFPVETGAYLPEPRPGMSGGEVDATLPEGGGIDAARAEAVLVAACQAGKAGEK